MLYFCSLDTIIIMHENTHIYIKINEGGLIYYSDTREIMNGDRMHTRYDSIECTYSMTQLSQ